MLRLRGASPKEAIELVESLWSLGEGLYIALFLLGKGTGASEQQDAADKCFWSESHLVPA